MSKRIKIKHSGFSDHCWYNKFCGQDFEFITEDENNYYVKTGDKIGSVEKVDGEVIGEECVTEKVVEKYQNLVQQSPPCKEEIITHPLLNDLLQQQKIAAQKPTKQSEGKLFWEINWDYLEGVAKRMQANKGDKYEKFAWKKGVDVDEINQAILRHTVEIMKGNTIDDTEYGHYEALCCNAMLAVHELKRVKNIAK